MPFAVFFGAVFYNVYLSLRQNIPFRQNLTIIGALVASWLLGPGLIVNVLLKEFVLRTRPRDVNFFGGEFPFVPVGQWYGICSGNCSFVSGEASIAPFMVLNILLLPEKWRKSAFLVLFPASIAMALLRVVMGAHYISDVVLGYGLTVLIFCIFAHFLTWQKNEKAKLINLKQA
ncbi:MAG: phosphatase PAP2 family protein [Notoacmeibacter sp.]